MKRKNRQWYTIDLHLHTPASADFQEPDVTFLDILRRAEARGLSAIAFTDHNTVAGYRRMREEIAFLETLEARGRLTDEERRQLAEYRHVLEKLVVFPGFEFTATLGFHILGIFPPEKTVREIEHILLDLNIPDTQLDKGSMTVGATSDVLTAYRKIDEAGGLAIAAHANSTHGVALRGFDFGGQTKIAYTQDEHLHALEVTDLEQRGRRSTAAFFNGAKPEYPRRMHCIQGSDAHRLRADPGNRKNLGVGDRATDVLLPEFSFAALRDLFLGSDFSRTRPHRAVKEREEDAYDYIQSAREEGPSIIQDFHESMAEKGGKLYEIIANVCAFANTNGGTLYIGVAPNAKTPPVGIVHPARGVALLERAIGHKISPALSVAVDVQETRGKRVIRVMVPRGADPPYAVEGTKIYIRDEDETGLAVRDEVVRLIERRQHPPEATVPAPAAAVPPAPPTAEAGVAPPRTGVEIVGYEERDGVRYFTVRDLRNGNMVKNVTLASSRRLWHYAISEHAKLPAPETLTWQGDLALLKKRKRRGDSSYDLIQRTPKGYRWYFGVSEDGIHGEWKRLVGAEEE